MGWFYCGITGWHAACGRRHCRIGCNELCSVWFVALAARIEILGFFELLTFSPRFVSHLCMLLCALPAVARRNCSSGILEQHFQRDPKSLTKKMLSRGKPPVSMTAYRGPITSLSEQIVQLTEGLRRVEKTPLNINRSRRPFPVLC